MKITCESCQAKYSIADEKVAGRVFKIRCKRCGEVIIVKGDEEPAQKDVAAQEPEVAGDAVWHVVINGEQFGPYQPAQIGELLATGQIDWEAYVWREGFDNWMPACDVDDLVSAISGPQAEQQGADQAPASDFSSVPELGGGVEQPTSIFDKSHAGSAVQPGARPSVEPASMGADPFAEDTQGAGGGVFDGPSADASVDVFGAAAAASPFDGGDDYVSNEGVVASGASPRVSVNAMTGARNENSVLFSLKNLQALATGSSSGSIPPAATMATPGKAGLASGEGSGLIDIRALASAAGIAQGDEQFADRDELLSMGSKTGAFGTLGSPMAPTAPIDESGRNKLVFAILGGAAFLAVAMIAVAFIFRGAGPDQPAAAVATVAPSTEAKSPAETAPVENKQQEEEKLSEGELAARAAAAQDEEGQDNDSRTHSSQRKKSRATGSSSTSHSKKPTSAEPPEKPSEPERPVKKRSTGKESIDDLLAGALSGSSKPKTRKTTTPAASAGPKLPTKPSRDDVLRSLRKVQPAVQECAKGQSGIAMADIVVANSGRVKNVRVSRVTGPMAGCIARAVRKARFPQFSSPEFSVSFPFRL